MTRPALKICACVLALLFGSGRTFAHGDLHERINALTAQLDGGVTNAAAWLERADLQRQHGEYAAALADAREAARLRPEWAAPRLQQARVFFEQSNFSAAKTAAEDALQLQPDLTDALVIRSRCLSLSGQTNAAIADLNRVLSLRESTLPDLYLERARLQAGAGEFAAAVTGLEEGIRKLGNTPSLALPALEYERQQGAWEAALLRVGTLKTFLPRASQALLRGEILLAAGRNAEARRVFETALAGLNNPSSRPTVSASDIRAQLKAALKRAEASSPQPKPTLQ